MSNEQIRQKMKKALVEREIANRKAEAKKDGLFFQKIAAGLYWNIFRVAAGICAVLAVLFTVDTFVDGGERSIPNTGYTFERWRYPVYGHQTVIVDNEIYTPSFEQLFDFDIHSFKVHNSFIFQDPKFITFNSSLGDNQRADRRVSVYEYFPLIQLLLLVPLAVIFYKRQNGMFFLFWGVTILLIYPSALYMLLSRIF